MCTERSRRPALPGAGKCRSSTRERLKLLKPSARFDGVPAAFEGDQGLVAFPRCAAELIVALDALNIYPACARDGCEKDRSGAPLPDVPRLANGLHRSVFSSRGCPITAGADGQYTQLGSGDRVRVALPGGGGDLAPILCGGLMTLRTWL